MPDVAVAIPTFRRPQGLKRLLDALARLDTRANVEVLVADNDAEGREGFDLCRALAPNFRWPLSAIVVPERGIAQARNGLVDHLLAQSRAQFVAMLDDDERPDKDWLDALLQVQSETQADAVRGTVLREFERAPGIWARHCKGIAALRRTSGLVSMIEGAGNALVARQCLEELPKPCFDPQFALSGGEDRDFFTRLRALGKRFAWAEDAIAYEFVPASRVNFRWALSRAYRVGNSDMRVFLKHTPSWSARAQETLKILGAVTLYPLLQLALAPLPAHRVRPLCTLYRAAGKIAALRGRHYNEYAAVHGG